MYEEILAGVVESCQACLREKLVGVYLHGSLAMGCFNPSKSDLDLLVVVNGGISHWDKRELMERIVKLNVQAPAKGIELSLVQEKDCKNFTYPTPFALHFSPMHLGWYESNPVEYVDWMNGKDKDLAAHFVVTRSRGKVLWGKDINEVFGEVPEEAYLDSIKDDSADAESDIFEKPIYVILNLARVLAYCREKAVLSKKEGGEWALLNLPEEYHALVKEALDCYGSERKMKVEKEPGMSYCSYMKQEIGF